VVICAEIDDSVALAGTAHNMRKVFLSHSFADADRVLASQVENLIRSHGLVVCTGRNLAGGPLGGEIARLIEDADGLVALCTQRAVQPDGVTHPWVLQEYALARAAADRAPAKRVVAVWQKGIPVQGMDAGFEHVDYDSLDPAAAFLRLSEILGEWNRRAGRFLKVQLMPEDVARRIGQVAERVQCEFRWQADGREGNWQPVQVRRELGGVLGYLWVPDNAEMIQLRAAGPNVSCESPYTPLRMFVQMEQTP
jgi:hypothetical protein